MRRRSHRRPAPENHDRWLVSYADFITLLFAFFVVMFSASQVDERRVGKLAHQMQASFQELGVFPPSGVKVPLPEEDSPVLRDAAAGHGFGRIEGQNNGGHATGVFEGIAQELHERVKSQIENNSVTMRTRSDGMVISLQEIGFFDSGSATIKPEAITALEAIAETLAANPGAVKIEGHTDNIPIHNARFDSNWELSTARATEIVKYFVVTAKFPAERISAAGYAEFHPVASNDTAAGRGLNRRVDIVIAGPTEARH